MMKAIIYNFIKKIWKILISFFITLITVLIASDRDNIVYEFMSSIDITDNSHQYILLSAIIVALIGALQLIVQLFYKLFLYIMSKYLKRLTLEIKCKMNNREKNQLQFKPQNYEYEPKKVDLELKISPAGLFTTYLLKVLGLQIKIFFNPQIIDVTLVNDKQWEGEKADSVIGNDQEVCISILANYRLGGQTKKPFKRTESLLIVPKRVNEDTAHLDFKLTSIIAGRLSSSLCSYNLKELNIVCEGVK